MFLLDLVLIVKFSYHDPKSTRIFAVAQAALRISVPGASHLTVSIRAVCKWPLSPHDPKFDWDFCCGPGGFVNLCPSSLSFGRHHYNWL